MYTKAAFDRLVAIVLPRASDTYNPTFIPTHTGGFPIRQEREVSFRDKVTGEQYHSWFCLVTSPAYPHSHILHNPVFRAQEGIRHHTMPPRRKATTAATPQDTTTAPVPALNLGDLPLPPGSDDDITREDMATLTAMLEQEGSQPVAGPSSAPAGGAEPLQRTTTDKGKGPAIEPASPASSPLAGSPTLSELERMERINGTAGSGLPAAPSHASSPRLAGPTPPLLPRMGLQISSLASASAKPT
ncbi:hypothetical protein JOM56_000111 [Amanita muscaria]